jgi:vacuolar-type H+-ATPase subunit E/Vma4
MTLENVKKEIMEGAQRKVQELQEQTKVQTQNIEQASKEEFISLKETADTRTNQVMQSIEAKMRSQAKFDARKKILQTKREAVNDVLLAVEKKLLALDDIKRKKLLLKLLDRAKKEINVHYIYVNKRDLHLISKSENIKPADIKGGLIAETLDHTVSVNLSITEILSDIKEKHLIEISGALFK